MRKSQNKDAIQFLLDVKYLTQYEKAFQKLSEQLRPILNGGEMIIAKIEERNLMDANYYSLITAKNSKEIKSLLDKIPESQYHKEYIECVGLEKEDVKIITTVNVEF